MSTREAKGLKQNAKRAIMVAAGLASSALFGGRAHADGTFTQTMTGDFTWNGAGWTITGDTGGQVFPGDALGDGTEIVIGRPVNGGRTFNISAAASNTTNIYTLASITNEQTTNAVTRGLTLNYQGATNIAKFELRVPVFQHVDGAGIVSSGGGNDGLNNAFQVNGGFHINTGTNALVLNANTASNPLVNAHVNHRANIALKFDDSDITAAGITTQGNKSVEIENNNTNRVAAWNLTGDLRLEGTGQFRFRFYTNGAAGDLLTGVNFTNWIAAAPGTGYANANFERAAGNIINRIQFQNTILNSNLFFDPNNIHVQMGNIQVNGNRNVFAFDGTQTVLTNNGFSYTGISGAADSQLNLTGSTWTLDKDVSATMLGKISIADAVMGFNSVGAAGAQAIAKRWGEIDLNVTPGASDTFKVETGGTLTGNSTQFAPLTVGVNVELEPLAIIGHDTMGTSASNASTLPGLSNTHRAVFGLRGADVSNYDITVGGTNALWAGIGNGRATRRWNSGVIAAEGDFVIMSAVRGITGNPIIFGNGTSSTGTLFFGNATGTTNKVNVDVIGRVEFAHNLANFAGMEFHVKGGSEVRLYADNALGGDILGDSTIMNVEAGALVASSSNGRGGSTAVGPNVTLHLKTGSIFQINGQDLTGANAGMNGLGTITREPNITFWANHSQALVGTQWNHTNILPGDVFRINSAANDIVNLNLVGRGVSYVLTGGDSAQGGGMFVDGGGVYTDGSSRTLGTSAAGLSILSVGTNGTTFAASTPTIAYDIPEFAPTFNVTGTNTLTINMNVRPSAEAILAGTNSGKIMIGTTELVERRNMMGNVIINGDFVTAGTVEKINPGDFIMNGPNTSIGGDLIAGGSNPPIFNPNVKFGNNGTNLSGGIISGTVIAGSLILKPFTKTDLNINTTGFNGTAGTTVGRLGVNLKIVLDGAPSPDGRRIYVDRRDGTAGSVGLINLNQITIMPGATLNVDEATTDVWVVNPTIQGDFIIDRAGAGDNFDFGGVVDAAAPVTITHGLVTTTNISQTGFFGTVGANITVNNIRGQVNLNDGANFNGTLHTQNVPAGGDSWVRILGGASGANFVTGSGRVNLGGTTNVGEDLFIYVNDHADTPITNSTDLRIDVVAGQLGQIVSDRIGTDLPTPGNAQVTNVHLNEGSSLFLQQNQDTTLRAGLVLEGNATVRMNDDGANGRIIIGNVSGAFTLNANTENAARTLTFNGNATNNKIVIGSTGNPGGAEFKTGANLPAVEAGAQATILVAGNESATVSSIKSSNPTAGAVNLAGTLAIRDTGSQATSTTSKVADLTLSGGKLDLGNGRLAVDYVTGATPYVTLRDQIVLARNGGTWDGTQGIGSSMVSADTNRLAVGIGEASTVLGISGAETAVWFGETVDADTVLMRGTILGDTDLDGAVSFVDLLKVSANFGLTGMLWTDGDSDFDGAVTFVDLLGVAANFGSALPASIPGASAEFNEALALAGAQVPEPGALGLIGLAVAAMGRRRRK